MFVVVLQRGLYNWLVMALMALFYLKGAAVFVPYVGWTGDPQKCKLTLRNPFLGSRFRSGEHGNGGLNGYNTHLFFFSFLLFLLLALEDAGFPTQRNEPTTQLCYY